MGEHFEHITHVAAPTEKPAPSAPKGPIPVIGIPVLSLFGKLKKAIKWPTNL